MSLSATLSWQAPTTFTDGSAIASPITYNLYQGSSPTTLAQVASGVTALTETLSTGLTSNATYFWTVTAVVAGVESAQATPVSKSFSGTPGPVINLTVT